MLVYGLKLEKLSKTKFMFKIIIDKLNKKKNIILVENNYAKQCLNELRGVYQS